MLKMIVHRAKCNGNVSRNLNKSKVHYEQLHVIQLAKKY